MGETADHPSPIWRTPLAAALAAWMAGTVGATLAVPAILEGAPDGTGLVILAAIFVVPPPILMVWSFWTLLQDPETGWIAPTVLMGFLGAFVPGFQPLLDAGVRMNFETRRPAYEAVVRDARAGRLVGLAGPGGWIAGESRGVRFRFRPEEPGVVDFVWYRDYGVRAGVRHDDAPCVARPGFSCVARGEPLDGPFTYYLRVF
jgi:hypothetical protein